MHVAGCTMLRQAILKEFALPCNATLFFSGPFNPFESKHLFVLDLLARHAWSETDHDMQFAFT